jgi:hypothetical protein
LQYLWTRRGGMIATLGLAALMAVPATASVRRIIAVGDLHGDFAAWRDIARAAGLVDTDGNWAGKDTVLVQTGDAVDRGPDSRKIVEELMRLQHEAQFAGGQLISLVGNHEAMNVTGDFRYVSAADYAAYADSKSGYRRAIIYDTNQKAIAEAYHHRDPAMSGDQIKQAWLAATPLGSIEHQLAWSPKGAIGRWVVNNPAVALIDGTLFVHGGISPAYAHMPLDEINRQVSAALLVRSTDPKSIINDPLGPLWYRGLAAPNGEGGAPNDTAPPEPPVADQLTALLLDFGAQRIVIGHTPNLSGIVISDGGRLARIDTGISNVYGGRLSYLEITNGTPTAHTAERSSQKP